jgi:hypothetical protein
VQHFAEEMRAFLDSARHDFAGVPAMLVALHRHAEQVEDCSASTTSQSRTATLRGWAT